MSGTSTDVAAAVRRANAALRAHAGGLELVSRDDDAVTVRFTGACTGCPARPITLAATVRPLLAEHGISEVRAQGVRLDDDQARRLQGWLAVTPQ